MRTRVIHILNFLVCMALLLTAPLFMVSAEEKSIDIAQVAEIRLVEEKCIFNGLEQIPEVEVYIPDEEESQKILLKQGEDYLITAEDNKDAGTATYTIEGIEKYNGTIEGTFEIVPVDVSEVTVKDNLGTRVLEYNGKERVRPVSLYVGTTKLNPGDDYIVNYENNTNVGMATMMISSDNFNGVIEKKYQIAKKNLKDIDLDITVNKDNSVIVTGVNPEAGQGVREGKDFITTVKKDKSGYLIITIRAKEINYTGTVVKKVKANPEPVTVNPLEKKIKASQVKRVKAVKSKKKITLKWKKMKSVQGYVIRYGLKSNMKHVTVKKVKKNVNRYTLKKLQLAACYYVQVRGYKKIGKKYCYSKWSSKKKIKLS